MRIVTLCLLALIINPVCARSIYVQPNAAPDGDGTRGKPLALAVAVGADSPAKPGDTISLAGGIYEGPIENGTRLSFVFGISGAADQPITIQPQPGTTVHLNGSMEVKGSHLRIVGLEVGDLKWDPTEKNHKTSSALTVIGGDSTSIINCNFFGGAMGTGLWSPATNLTLYGCIVHDFGTMPADSGRGHGHAFYTQNETGTKTIEQCLAYRGCGWNLHVYTQRGQIIGFDIIDNIMYIAGSRADRPQTVDNYLIAGRPPADRIRLIGNVGYQPQLASRYRPNARLSNYADIVNGSAEVKDNCFIGAVFGLSLGNWRNLTMTGNTIGADEVLVEINSAPTGCGLNKIERKPDLAGYAIDHNTYFANAHVAPFRYTNVEPLGDEVITFAQWQALGLDAHSTMIPTTDGRPTMNQVFVYANKYEQGRGHVGIFNWQNLDAISVNLAEVLKPGQKYTVFNCLDITQTIAKAKPVLVGTYDGGDVILPMRKSEVSPDFDAFLILPSR